VFYINPMTAKGLVHFTTDRHGASNDSFRSTVVL